MSIRGPSTGGVRAKPNNRIQFDFMLDGVRYRPTVRRTPTTQNLNAARERLAGIRQRIRAGTFHFDEEFPAYRFLGRVIDPSQVQTCDKVFDQFIAHCESRFRRDDLAWATVAGYRRVLNALWRPRIGALPFLRVDYVTLARVADAYHCSRKTFNNAVSVLRRAFEFGCRNHPHHINPARGLRGCRMSRKDRIRPDPFRIDEAEQLIVAIRADWGEAQANYDEFRFFTGLRPSEQIALSISDFDSARGTLRVNKARVAGVDRATTKTGVHRVFELCPRALAVLHRQLKLRERLQRNSRLHHDHIFVDDHGAPLQSIHEVGARWAKTLARLPVRPRRPYCARHSSVSWNLMLGKNPLWVARQHGHSVRTMLEVYAAWADGAVESDLFAIRRSMGLLGDGTASDQPGLLRRLAGWLIRDARPASTAGSSFNVWHWIWHQERGVCT
jgi:integrase